MVLVSLLVSSIIREKGAFRLCSISYQCTYVYTNIIIHVGRLVGGLLDHETEKYAFAPPILITAMYL